MSLAIHDAPLPILTPDEIAEYRDVPVSIIGDELNRAQMMHAAIKPVAPATRLCGLALTVRCMVGDNSALHHAIANARPGDIIVADAGAHENTAVWGGIMHEAAVVREIGGVIIDGAMRDVEDLRASSLAAYCRAISPAGPHKGFGGEINCPVQCGGADIRPGDLVVGDDDGVVVVRPDQIDGLLVRCRARMAKEEDTIAQIRAGKTTVELHGLDGPAK